MDCSKGTREQRWAAYRHNRESRHLLLPSMTNWMAGGIGCFALLWGGELLQKFIGFDLPYLLGALGIAVTLCVMVLALHAVMYSYLTWVKEEF